MAWALQDAVWSVADRNTGDVKITISGFELSVTDLLSLRQWAHQELTGESDFGAVANRVSAKMNSRLSRVEPHQAGRDLTTIARLELSAADLATLPVPYLREILVRLAEQLEEDQALDINTPLPIDERDVYSDVVTISTVIEALKRPADAIKPNYLRY
ncbi:hypothetical protein EUV02_03980 [Polymorphobacter arshaanensis]|uniref:Uncharacterized protein n=1 Tax=Glacieibacterium arshaanense TaxID=2511025 RepID=A0A4Y9ES50_9SPHN|nr:hypothetical protein [Polymorphobacter arshaanensis]TFU06180.1 hypothetical protein EUV02_03980 [Polymorphobacter arshaanensis]